MTKKKSMFTRVAAVTGAAAIAISGATGVAGAQEAPAATGSINSASVEQLQRDANGLVQNSISIAAIPFVAPFMLLSMAVCNPDAGECQ